MTDPRRHAWSRPSLRGNRGWPSSTSRSVGKTLPDDAFDGQISASDVVHTQFGPVGIAEVEFGQVAPQVSFADVLINAVNTAFQVEK